MLEMVCEYFSEEFLMKIVRLKLYKWNAMNSACIKKRGIKKNFIS